MTESVVPPPERVATQARSRLTQSRILAAARRLFAEDGYERTTIRGVAQAAQTDAALVMRYFGSKDGLFAAATSFDLRLPALDAGAAGQAGATLIRHFLVRWEGDPDDQALRILLRAGVTNADAAARIRALFAEQVLPLVRRIGPDQPEVRAGLLASQIIGLALTRYILVIAPLAEMPPEAVVAWIGPTLQRYLTGCLPAP